MYRPGNIVVTQQPINVEGRRIACGTPVEILASQEFQGYQLYTIRSSGVTCDVDDSYLAPPPQSDRDRWAILLFAAVVGGGLLILLARNLLLGY